MAYTPTIWKDGQAPALNAANLNHMEDGIVGAEAAAAEAKKAVEAMADPMGPWIYCGKITNVGKENKLSYNIENLGKTPIELMNQICLKINKISKQMVASAQSLSFYVGYTHEGVEESATSTDDVYLPIMYPSTPAVGTDLQYEIKNAIFTFNKGLLGVKHSTNGRPREDVAYIAMKDLNVVAGKLFSIYTDKPFKSIYFYLTNSGTPVTVCDADVYIR